MKSLFALSPDVVALDSLLDECGGELDPGTEAAFESWLAEIRGREAVKLDGYCYLIAERLFVAEALRAKAKEFTEKARTAENKAAYLKNRLLQYMEATGQKKIVTADGQQVTRQKTGGQPRLEIDAAVLADPKRHLQPELVEEIVIVRPNAKAIRERLAAGLLVPGACLVALGEYVRINGGTGLRMEATT
jgi:hypothetical protein